MQGTVEGLIRGGYISFNSKFSLPQNGSFIVNVDSDGDKFNNARSYYYNNVGGDLDLSTGMKAIA